MYRDRAAERRTLHGGFGVGPGQKNSKFDEDEQSSSYASANTEEAAAEALNMSFGAVSYARKLLEGMGWKEVCSHHNISVFFCWKSASKKTVNN